MTVKLLKNKIINYFFGLFFVSLILVYPLLAEEEPNSNLSISQILSSRYSGYLYDSTRPVTYEQLLEILEAGHLAPSAHNEQPWNFIVCDRNTNPEAFNKVLDTLIESNRVWAQHASILIITVAANKFSYNGKLNQWGQYDTGAAVFSMMLKATSIGLMAHQIGGFDKQRIQDDFLIPEGYELMTVMAIGYQSSEEVQPERKRKPLNENFFIGSWGKSFN